MIHLARSARRAALALAAGVLAVGALPAPAGAAPGPGPLARYHQQRLIWKSCVLGPDDTTGRKLEQAGARCADVTVPLDYARPGGRTLTVAISRIRATDPGRRAGPLLLNGGGPGGPSLGDGPGVRETMGDVAARYDLVGVDPRFTGRSTPLDCHWPTGSAWRGAGGDRAGFDRVAAFSRDLAERCRTHAGDVLPHATTLNTARDMDVVRAALGARRISYLGYSYGSYLGQVYASLFPGRTGRMVLDGVLDPDRYGARLWRHTLPANRRALEGWASWTAARDAAYGLGRTRGEVLAALERIRVAAGRSPLRLGAHRLDEHVLPVVVLNGLSQHNDTAYGDFAQGVRDMLRTAEGRRVTPSPGLAEVLAFLLTGADSAYGSAQTAIVCGDSAAPRDPEVYWRDVQRARSGDPLLGPVAQNLNPCAYWDGPRERPARIRGDLAALLVNATGDPRTPYDGAEAVRARWPSSRLVTLDGADQHGVYGVHDSVCVRDAVNAYLATGRLPGRDVTCPA
ncbi:alpha/beta hydrolase [Streptomyces sp. bgisy032]|uniref:alpha/beta hydrolase n=1 Tax=Streptomyces sp. bgisy032 TaxID=3413773 RepID=UPI003D73EDDE